MPIKTRELPTLSLLNSLFSISDSGELVRKIKASSRAQEGTTAGYVGKDGYIIVGVNAKQYPAHRIIYYIHNGSISTDMEIDHIDGNRSNNRPANLRQVNRSQNNQNRSSARSDSVSGIRGVGFDKSRGKWYANIGQGGRLLNLGRFDTPEAAMAARERAEARLFTHSSRRAAPDPLHSPA